MLNNLLEKLKFKEKIITKTESTVFINKPIESANDDLVGFDVQIKSIKDAIKKGANSIGVISDYGTGKSSLTELIGLEDENYCIPIKVNLWDCLSDGKEHTPTNGRETYIDSNIKVLTKSFLFQLASGDKSNKLAKHINKRLSKNYGILSFSITSNAFWLWLGGAAIAYCLYLIFDLMPTAFINQTLISKVQNFMWVLEMVKYIRPLLLIASIIFVVLGIKNTDIAFSLWDSQGKREPEINDVFDIYLHIVERLSKKNKSKKQLIIIEDLDRITDKVVAVDFLREIYRFNNLLSSDLKEQFVFIVSVKPESLLNGGKNTDEVYPKIFDYTISLKPLHNEDYKSVVLKLIEQNKAGIRNLTGLDIKGDDLPKEFEWILTGSNLTVRDLKQRLNQGLLLYGVLKSKLKDGNAAVDLRRCMAVSYLENAFSKAYYNFIIRENEFSKLVEFSYKIKNDVEYTNTADSEKENLIAQYIVELYENKKEGEIVSEFNQLIARLLFRGIIDNDFRMYFYSYPKGSYVKDTDEKYISNLIELPEASKKIENLDKIIERMGEKADRTITESYISLMKRELPLPRIIFENDKMFTIAATNHLGATVSLILGQLKWNTQNINSTKTVFAVINNYGFKNKEELFEEYTNQVIIEQIPSMQETDICKMRLALIEAIGENIIYCKDLFVGEGMPIISSAEIHSNISISIKLRLINAKLIIKDNIYDIYTVIYAQKLSVEDYQVLENIYQNIDDESITDQILANVSIDIITINNSIDESKFGLIVKSCIESGVPSKSHITSYLKILNVNDIPLEYLKNIDELMLDDDISDQILERLKENNLYHTYLLCMTKKERLSEMKFEDEAVCNNIFAAIPALNENDNTISVTIRTFILQNKIELAEKYKKLFFGDYPLITLVELQEFNNLGNSLQYLDFNNFNTENQADMFTEYINSLDLSQNDEIIFLSLFGKQITDIGVIAEIFATLDYEKIDFKNLSADILEEFVTNVSTALNLGQAPKCLEIMQKMGVLIESLEEILYSVGLEPGTIAMDEYIKLINDIAQPTGQTIAILCRNKICWGLTENITDKLFRAGYIKESIVGKTLWDERFDFDKDKIDFEIYLSLYLEDRYIFKYMANNNDFLNYIIDNQKYNDFPVGISIEKLQPLYNCEQTLDFIKYLFGILDETQKRDYLLSFKSLKTKEESIAFGEFMLEDGNSAFLENESDFYKIKEKLWEDAPQYKAAFTRKRNKMYPKKVLEAVLL